MATWHPERDIDTEIDKAIAAQGGPLTSQIATSEEGGEPFGHGEGELV